MHLSGPAFDTEKDLRFARRDRLLGEALLLGGCLLPRRYAKLTLTFKDGTAEVAGQRWSKHRRLRLHSGIVLGKRVKSLRRWLTVSVVEVFRLLFDAQCRSLKHRDAQNGSRCDCSDGDDHTAPESHGAAG